MNTDTKANEVNEGFAPMLQKNTGQPRLAVWEAFHDTKAREATLDGEIVVEFAKLTERLADLNEVLVGFNVLIQKKSFGGGFSLLSSEWFSLIRIYSRIKASE